MEVKCLNNDELINIFDYLITITDATIPDFFSLIPEDFMKELMEKGETEAIPHLEVIGMNLYAISEIEKEMHTRGILEEYMSKKPFVNYETGTMYTYENYASRYAHLCYFKKHGFLELDKVIAKSTEAKASLEELKKREEASKEALSEVKFS